MNENELMGSMKVSKAVAKMAIPSVISSLVTVVYNMADTFFVGQTGDPLQVAAVSLTNPIFILLMAFANMFGMGGSAVASMAMGEKNEKRVKNTSAFVTYASLIVGILFALILIFFVKPILYTFGANSQTYEMAKGYTFHVSYGAPFIIWSAASSFIVRAEGASSEAMIGSMIGTVANIVLDPVFISGLGMGAAGAAIATTIGNILASIYYLWYFMKKLFCQPEVFQMRRAGFIKGMFDRFSDRNFFSTDECINDRAESDSGQVRKCTGGGDWNCIQGKYVYYLPSNGTCKRRAAADGLQFWGRQSETFYGSGLFYEKMLSGRWNPGDGIIFLFSRTNYPPVH